jgi:hypothetical protein
LRNQEEPEAPTVNALKRAKGTVTKTTKSKEGETETISVHRQELREQRRKGKKTPENYKLELIHDSNRGMILALHLCSKRSASTVIQVLQSSTEGFLFLKITSFLIIQIPQQNY